MKQLIPVKILLSGLIIWLLWAVINTMYDFWTYYNTIIDPGLNFWYAFGHGLIIYGFVLALYGILRYL